jgi:2',3'-cyclic-nucleotide 2'-phosphodiesterase (5'-nucleotidase family)
VIRVYHTSDLHDRRHIVAPLRALRAARPGLLVDCGDALRGSQTIYYRNEPVIDELNAAQYDVTAMGNREFHYVFGAVRARLRKMTHPVVCANLADTRGRSLPFTADAIVHAGDGEAVRFFGLLVPQYPAGSPWERIFGWRFNDPLAIAAEIARTTPPDVTLVALSHLGLRADRLLAQQVPRLDLILGGHSHDTLAEPEVVAGVPIVHAGPYGAVVARIELERSAGRARITGFALEPLTPRA